MRTGPLSILLSMILACGGCASLLDPRELSSCFWYVKRNHRDIATDPAERFLGKVLEDTARCRGGDTAVSMQPFPWVDWQNYWAMGNANSKSYGLNVLFLRHMFPNGRGIGGALLDFEHQRMEMIKFNLFDNSGTYEKYVTVLRDPAGVFSDPWPQMRLQSKDAQEFTRLQAEGLITDPIVGSQQCTGKSIRFRDRNGYCNDIFNPLMGSTNQPFARNVQFDAVTFPDLEEPKKIKETKNRHGQRLALLEPNPQVISRKLFSRDQAKSMNCNEGRGATQEPSLCHYEKADWFNVLAAFWIQFMTHDWFSHLDEGQNSTTMMSMGCTKELEATIKCRSNDQIGTALIQNDDPGTFRMADKEYLKKAQRTTLNRVTAWWDASQIYGYDTVSMGRVKVNQKDKAKLDMVRIANRTDTGDKQGYLPEFSKSDHINPAWEGQEATAFPDNWSIGLSFFHNVFAREHNLFVEKFKELQMDEKKMNTDSGLRRPESPDPKKEIPYKDVTPEEIFQIARLVVSAEIAKIHTIEWTTQLLYNEALYRGMNANWSGLLKDYPAVSDALESVMGRLKQSGDVADANLKYSAYAAGPGIFGLGNQVRHCWYVICGGDTWSIDNANHINGGTHHFGSPFNFPEEFITVYRLHPMVPDLIEYRDLKDEHSITRMIPVVSTFRKTATVMMREFGLANWGLSMGRQRLGRLTLFNHPQFLQNLEIAQDQRIDVAALDIIRDRERGVPRFNEFRRQYGLTTLTSFNDFIDKNLEDMERKVTIDPATQHELDRQREIVTRLKEIYGRHTCDKSKIITTSQKTRIETPQGVQWKEIDDCLGHEDGDEVDNVEDLDTVVGWLAEPVRPHGFAISETQFQVFILNASRRLFSDRFFTSSFRPEFYTHLGVEWINNNGPAGKCIEKGWLFSHEVDRSPLKCVLRRTIPELEPKLEHVVNAFDPWARDRGEYYDLKWKARKDAKSDEAFH